MTERLVLMFAYSFPPKNETGAARPSRFSKYLSRRGYTCRVFTASDQIDRSNPSTDYVPDPVAVLPQSSFRWQLERAVRKFVLPGEMGMQWSLRAADAARAYVRGNPGACVTIFSTFPPLGSHLAAWQLARSEGLRWIADFRDPLVEGRIGDKASPFHKRLYRWLERTLVQTADAVVANTDAAKIRWQEKFPSFSDRVHLIWNGFDPEDRVQPLPIPLRGYKILSHVGELYNGRNATPILEAFSRLIAAGRLSIGRVRVRLIGPVETGAIPSPEFVHRARTAGWLDIVAEQIPQREARQIAQTSDGLLLLQPQSAVQVPAKVFEYLQIGRPILAFIQPNSPSEQLLKQSGIPHRCVYPDTSPHAIDDIVAGFFDLPSTAAAPSPWFEDHFNAERQTRMLDAIIRSLHSEQLSSKLLPDSAIEGHGLESSPGSSN